MRAATGREDTAAELTLAFVAELVADQLSVEAIHRLYADVDPAVLRDALDRFFVRTPLAAPDADDRRRDGRGGLPRAGDRPTGPSGWTRGPAPSTRCGPSTGSGWRRRSRGWPCGRRTSTVWTKTLRAVAEGRAAAAVLVRPVSLAEIERTAREGLLMPPKSTFFTPKLKTGAVLRPLDD